MKAGVNLSHQSLLGGCRIAPSNGGDDICIISDELAPYREISERLSKGWSKPAPDSVDHRRQHRLVAKAQYACPLVSDCRREFDDIGRVKDGVEEKMESPHLLRSALVWLRVTQSQTFELKAQAFQLIEIGACQNRNAYRPIRIAFQR
jgi:hypothetical protein